MFILWNRGYLVVCFNDHSFQSSYPFSRCIREAPGTNTWLIVIEAKGTDDSLNWFVEWYNDGVGVLSFFLSFFLIFSQRKHLVTNAFDNGSSRQTVRLFSANYEKEIPRSLLLLTISISVLHRLGHLYGDIFYLFCNAHREKFLFSFTLSSSVDSSAMDRRFLMAQSYFSTY